MDPASTTLALLALLTLFVVNAGVVLLLARRLARRRARTQPTDSHNLAQQVLAAMEDGDGAQASDEEQMLLGVFQFRDTLAREVMTPRRDIIALPATATEAETMALVADEGHSRIPVYEETLDDIVGVLLAKDLLTHMARKSAGRDDASEMFDLRRLMREPYFVPDTKRIGELLAELKARSVHMAILLDEFGGTEGLLTLEDLLEEIVGDIYDEFDEPETSPFDVADNGEVLIDGGASISEFNDRFGMALPERDFDTVGGFVFGELGRVPVAGDTVSLNGSGELRVEGVEDRRVTRLRLIPETRPSGATDATDPTDVASFSDIDER
ncbi:hypothetical protein BH23GEM9_BH23GEM9_31490 [soil metagenome]